MIPDTVDWSQTQTPPSTVVAYVTVFWSVVGFNVVSGAAAVEGCSPDCSSLFGG